MYFAQVKVRRRFIITVSDEKKELRKRILTLRNEMTPEIREEKSNKILHALYATKVYKEADVILAYVEYNGEVLTTPLIMAALSDNKQVYVPKVSGDDMEFYRISGTECLVQGYKGIREPSCGDGFMDGLDSLAVTGEKILMLMPGTVFDISGHRIGYGKGFYDRYLMRLSQTGTSIYKTALCYECQLMDKIPCEAHDAVVDMIITENGKEYIC